MSESDPIATAREALAEIVTLTDISPDPAGTLAERTVLKIFEVAAKALASLSLPPVRDEAGEYLIWSNEHRAWWRPKSQGYTVKTKAAGRYSRAEALSICRARDGWDPSRAPDEVPVLAADIAEIEARALATPEKTDE